jgi:hypothetical protein
MSLDVSVNHGFSSNGLAIAGGQRQFSGDSQLLINDTIAIGATNLLILAAIDISQVQALAFYSSVDLTVKTNSSGSPTNTINLLAGKPYIWESGGYETCKITADVSSLYVTNASGVAAIFQVIALAQS